MIKLYCILTVLCAYTQVSLAQKGSLFYRHYRPPFQQASIKNFLDDMNRTTGVVIEYASSAIDTGNVVMLRRHSNNIGSVLQQVLQHQYINIIEKNNKLIIIPSSSLLPQDFFLTYYAVYGIIKEVSSGEPLANATVWQPGTQKGCLSNIHGHFTLLLPKGKQVLYVSYAGYNNRLVEIDLDANTRTDILLTPKSDIPEVTVVSAAQPYKKEPNLLRKGEDAYDIFLGESDVMRSLYMQPGVKNIPEITNGMLVRGGSPDQNVFLMDGNNVFNPTHLLGTVSIINKSSVKSLNLYKSHFPSRYGGGLSSVIDVQTKDGNMQQWKGEANAGLLAGSFTVEGPLKKDKAAIMVSYRHSWINPVLDVLKCGIDVNFYDLHVKYTQWLGKKDKLMLTGYAGHDRLKLHQNYTNNQQQWGNKTLSLTWNRLLGPRAFLNTSVNASEYHNIAGFRYSLYDSLGTAMQNRVYNTYSSVKHYKARTILELYAGNSVKINVGGKASFTRIHPFDSNIAANFIEKPDDFDAFPPLSFQEYVLFYENEIRLGNRFFLRPGMHVSHFRYKDFKYTSWQPRFYAIYRLTKQHQLEFSYNHMTQYMHLVTNPYLGINSDAWLPSTAILRPEEGDLFNIGYTWRGNKKLTIGAEVYYKQLKNVTNYAEGKNLFLNNAEWEQNVQLGKGWCYGLELKTEKVTDKWYLHLGYTLSWNWRKFKDINEGNKFPFKYDRRHDLNVAATYQLNKRWYFSSLWTFSTGDVFTLPDRAYPDFDAAQQIYDPLAPKEYRLIYHSSVANQYRTLPYHRLDISGSYRHHLSRRLAGRVTTGIYNIYGSPNQYMYDLQGTLGKRSLVVTTRYQFFKITPYLSYTVNF
jgi:hypothetical protein